MFIYIGHSSRFPSPHFATEAQAITYSADGNKLNVLHLPGASVSTSSADEKGSNMTDASIAGIHWYDGSFPRRISGGGTYNEGSYIF